MESAEGFIYVGFAESRPIYDVTIEFPGKIPLKAARGEKVTGIVRSHDQSFAGLAHSLTPLWFAFKGDDMRYEIRIFEDKSCEISRKWD
jgi:hypothetical protein